MDHSWTAGNQWPNRIPERWARALVALSLVALAIGALGIFLYDGWHRIAYVLAFGAMGVGNLSLAIGNLLPEGRASRAALVAVGPLTIVMALALGATLAFQVGCGS